jgi:thiamine-phosphate pyrophosphorylase
MAEGCVLYYITDRTAFAADEPTRRKRLLEKIAEAARAGVDYIQLREKNLPTRELELLACEAAQIIRDLKPLSPSPWPLAPALLVNSRTDIALAVVADGVHLRSDDISPQTVRKIWLCGGRPCGAGTPVDKLRAGSAREPMIAVSCHSPEEVRDAARQAASFAVFAPVFEKKDSPATKPGSLAGLEEACRATIPVLAMGGITLGNAEACLHAGAAGIAAIRLFQENDVARIVRHLRG